MDSSTSYGRRYFSSGWGTVWIRCCFTSRSSCLSAISCHIFCSLISRNGRWYLMGLPESVMAEEIPNSGLVSALTVLSLSIFLVIGLKLPRRIRFAVLMPISVVLLLWGYYAEDNLQLIFHFIKKLTQSSESNGGPLSVAIFYGKSNVVK